MVTETKTYQTNVVRPQPIVIPPTELIVPHLNGTARFAHPSQGPNAYRAVGKAILEAKQLVPTGNYTASLLAGTYLGTNKDEPEFQKVREIMRNRLLWVFNINYWIPEGVYVAQDLEALGRNQPLSVSDLEKALQGGKDFSGIRFSQDGRTSFAPKGSYKLGEHTPESLAKDGFVVASYGVEGAEKLGEVAGTFKNNPRTFGLEVAEGQAPELRVSAVDDFDGRLDVDGNNWYDYVGSRAFGVLK